MAKIALWNLVRIIYYHRFCWLVYTRFDSAVCFENVQKEKKTKMKKKIKKLKQKQQSTTKCPIKLSQEIGKMDFLWMFIIKVLFLHNKHRFLSLIVLHIAQLYFVLHRDWLLIWKQSWCISSLRSYVSCKIYIKTITKLSVFFYGFV